MILLIIPLLFTCINLCETTEAIGHCRDPTLTDWNTQAGHIHHLLTGYDLVHGPGGTNAWPIFRTVRPNRSNSTTADGCKTGKIRTWNGELMDIQLPAYIDKLDTYAEPAIAETILTTFNSTWRAYVDWRHRRSGTVITVTNSTKYEDLYTLVEYPFRVTSAALGYKNEFDRIIENGNRFFRISTTVVSGELAVRGKHMDQLDMKFVDYIQAALDGGKKLEQVNTLKNWGNDGYQYLEPADEKSQNWHVIFSDSYGTHYPTSIKFGYIFDIWINRTHCNTQRDAKLGELAQCYFAESKLNLSLNNAASAASLSSSKDASTSPVNGVEICPHLKHALHDLQPYFLHPSGRFEKLQMDSKYYLSDYLKRIPQEPHRLWQPVIVEAKMAPICELVPLIRPNDLDAKVACEKNLLKYLRFGGPNDDRTVGMKCGRSERRVITEDGTFCISTRFSDTTCPNRASGRIVIELSFSIVVLGSLFLVDAIF